MLTAAIFSDIHSNYPAFRACYADALARGAAYFIFLGDYVSDLAQPREVLDLVYEIRRSFPTHCLRGNRERYMLEYREGKADFRPGSKTGSLRFTYDRLREQDFRFLESLPIADTLTLEGVTFGTAHAVPGDDRFYFDRNTPELDAVFSQTAEPWLLTGHSHKQYLARRDGKTILNPGSIGVPQGGGVDAQYALLHIDKGTASCTLRRVPYDLAATVRAQFSSGLTDMAKVWAVSVLHDILTGRDYTIALLDRVAQNGSVWDEDNWHRQAETMEMVFSEEELLRLCP